MSEPKADDFLTIAEDGAKLPEECSGQPKLLRYWSRQWAAAKKKVTEAENKVKVVRAEVRTSIRANPAAYGMEKVTIDTVDDALEMDVEYQAAKQAVATAQYDADLLESNVLALKSRDYQLSNMNELLKLGQIPGPRVSPDVQQAYRESVNNRVNEALNRQDSKGERPKVTDARDSKRATKDPKNK